MVAGRRHPLGLPIPSPLPLTDLLMSTSFNDLLGSPPPVDPTLRAEFDDAFLHDPAFFAHARKRAKHGLSQSSLRSLHWRLFLDCLSPERVDMWEGQLSLQRRAYDDLLRTYKVTPSAHEERQKEQDEREKAQSHPPVASLPPPPTPRPPPSPPTDLKINNPLSTASSSPWRQYFHNSSLSQLITADLHRTEPDSGFFQSEGIQALMLNVLLVWAKLNVQYVRGSSPHRATARGKAVGSATHALLSLCP